MHRTSTALTYPSVDSNNNPVMEMVVLDSIVDFYKDKSIFLTGGTGFLGKAILEKLLRTCEHLKTVYLLMRPKYGMPIEERLNELILNPVFNRLRERNAAIFKKIYIISGDITQPNLGLSSVDRQELIDNVQLAVHSAATIKFNETLKNAVVMNVLGTKRVLELCRQMPKLQSFLHVSTAFSNCDRNTIDEIVYKPEYEPDAIIEAIETLDDKEIQLLTKKLLRNHPNTYTVTKAIAEYLVLECSAYIPATIVRPSIITAAWKDPYPGWVDNFSGVTGIIMECARGTITSILGNRECIMDVIPVDIVVNTIVTAIWHTPCFTSNAMRVYNCTSGNVNAIRWKYFGELTLKYSLEYPSKYVTWYPGFTYHTSKYVHLIKVWLYHLIPSALLDVFLYFTRQKPMMLKISKKFWDALENGSFFALREWDFKSDSMFGLIKAVQKTKDSKDFELSVSSENGFMWDTYIKHYILGIRQYVLKDNISSIQQAKQKLHRLLWFQRLFRGLIIYLLLRFTLKR